MVEFPSGDTIWRAVAAMRWLYNGGGTSGLPAARPVGSQGGGMSSEERRMDGESAEEAAQVTDNESELSGNTPLPSGSFTSNRKYIAYTVKLPAEQLAALQNIWLELKRLYGAHSPDKSGMIQQAVADWLRRWDGPDRQKLLQDLLEIREDTRKRQYRKSP